ncbi:MAG: putative glycoside hydrolase [Candidatus Paceibacterota bacterium]
MKRVFAGKINFIIIIGLALAGVFGFLYFQSAGGSLSYDIPIYGLASDVLLTEEKKEVPHLPTPEAVKAVYMTSCAVGTPSFREHLIDLIAGTELNSIIIDIKDYTGTMSYPPNDPELLHLWQSAKCGAPDMADFITTLHQQGVYVIGRITVFQDPHLTARRPDLAVKTASTGAIWRDNKGLSFTDPGARDVWDYHIALAKDAYDLGFDELNFDYIRFPSDGPMKDIAFPHSGNRPKPEVLEDFFSYLHQELVDTGMVTSADLFGMTTTNVDDLNIGQVLERALPYFDYIAPMVYPSHYPKNFNNWPDPNKVPYDIIKFSMDAAVRRTIAATTIVPAKSHTLISGTSTPAVYSKEVFSANKIRPWLQDFDYPVPYTPDMVRAQIKATYDAGLNSWMLWDPRNRYTRSALEPSQ